MLESIDFKAKKISKPDYKSQRKALMDRLVVLQQQARQEQTGIVVLFEGWNGAGKGSRISDLLYLLDARATKVCMEESAPLEDAELFSQLDSQVNGYYPVMKQFWDGLGERGDITFFNSGWYKATKDHLVNYEHSRWHAKARRHSASPRVPLKKLVKAASTPRKDLDGISTMDLALESIETFERALTQNGYTVVKFFVHITKKEQRKRIEKLYSDPATRWRVSDKEVLSLADYDDLYDIYNDILEHTDFGFAPWHILNGEDMRGSNLQIAQVLVDALEKALEAKQASKDKEQGPLTIPALSRFTTEIDHPTLENADHTLALPEKEYRKLLEKEQERLGKLELELYQQRVPLLIMYEGWDAAGKGGNIKRIAQALDARSYQIFPSPAPTKTELAHPHLWRYWTRLPKAGHIGIYDRSWYGRVLVERVEGFATPEEIARAYDEINEFEYELTRWGAMVVKFWVNVDFDEQLRRFEERQNTPSKQWKITEDDWRNRDKNPQYWEAVEDMFRLTSTTYAPWHLLESTDKYYARVTALRTINDLLEQRLGIND